MYQKTLRLRCCTTAVLLCEVAVEAVPVVIVVKGAVEEVAVMVITVQTGVIEVV